MQTPAYWDGTQWIVQSQAALTQSQLNRVARYLVNVQRQRRLETISGEKRDELDRTIRALREGRVVCGVTGGDVFKATVGTGKIISLGAR